MISDDGVHWIAWISNRWCCCSFCRSYFLFFVAVMILSLLLLLLLLIKVSTSPAHCSQQMITDDDVHWSCFCFTVVFTVVVIVFAVFCCVLLLPFSLLWFLSFTICPTIFPLRPFKRGFESGQDGSTPICPGIPLSSPARKISSSCRLN